MPLGLSPRTTDGDRTDARRFTDAPWIVPASQAAAKATLGQAGTVGIAHQDDPTEPARAAYRRATLDMKRPDAVYFMKQW
jgi:hypothetical protein